MAEAPQLSEFMLSYAYPAPYLDGVYLAVNALPDSYLVYDAHNCGYYKAEQIAGNHDLLSELMGWDQPDRILRTNLESREYVRGSDDQLSKKLRQVSELSDAALIFVASSNVMIFSGHDPAPVLRQMRDRSAAPLVRVPAAHQDRDHLHGYLDAVAGLLDNLFLDGEADAGGDVLLAGYVFERHEGDHQGNVAELQRLVAEGCGRRARVLLDGDPAAAWRRLPPPGLVVDLAGGWAAAEETAARLDVPCLEATLPVGLEGTAAWLRRLAGALGREEQAEAFIAREQESLTRQLRWLLPRYFLGRQVALFADRHWLPPLFDLLQELGLSVCTVGCTSRDAAGTRPPLRGPAAAAEQAPDQIPALLEHVAELRRRQELDLVIGNSFIHHLLAPLDVPVVDFGYPCSYHHALGPRPALGFAGVRTWAERMINALSAPAAGASKR